MSEIILILLSIFITLILLSIIDIYDIIKSINSRLDSIENKDRDKFDLEAQKSIVRKNKNK